jgi:hypothetical protein
LSRNPDKEGNLTTTVQDELGGVEIPSNGNISNHQDKNDFVQP